MIELLERLDGIALVRSLFLWQQILGTSTDAAARLRKMCGPLIRLPLGADVTPHTVTINASSTGFDIQEAVLPGADGVFAYVTEPGLRLSGAADTTAQGAPLRRLSVLTAERKPHPRQGRERFILRYQLPPQALAAPQLMFLAITQNPAPAAPARAQLHAWAEVEQGGSRQFVLPDESRVGRIPVDELAHLISFPHGALTQYSLEGATGLVSLCIELIADPLDVGLLGEALVIGG